MGFLFSLLFSKASIFGVGGLLIIAAVATAVLRWPRMWTIGLGIAAAVHIYTGTAYQNGRGYERGLWQEARDVEKARQDAAIDRAERAETKLANARIENEKLIDERQAKDADDIAREAVEEEASRVSPGGPAPPSGTVVPCQCLDSDRDVKRLRDALR